MDLLKNGAIAQLGGRGVSRHVTVLPGQSQENLPNPPSAHLYSAGGVAGFSHLSLTQLWANRRLLRDGNTTNQNGRDLSYFPTFFLLIQGFVIEIYTL